MAEVRSATDLCEGDEPAEVLIARTAGRDTDNKIIHTGACQHVRQRGRERYRPVAPEALTSDWRVCRWCSDSVDPDVGGHGRQTCPRCGDAVAQLPAHLRSDCDGGDSDA